MASKKTTSKKTEPVVVTFPRNVIVAVDKEEGSLIAELNLKKSCGMSKSGKSEIIGTTGKPQNIGGYMVSITVFKYPDNQ